MAFLFFEFSCMRPRLLKSETKKSTVCSVMFHWVLHRYNWILGTIPHASKSVEHFCKFVPKRIQWIWYHVLLSSTSPQIFVQHFHSAIAVHLLVAGLLLLMAHRIYSGIHTSVVAMRWIVGLILQHVRFIIPDVDDACGEIGCRREDHEL